MAKICNVYLYFVKTYALQFKSILKEQPLRDAGHIICEHKFRIGEIASILFFVDNYIVHPKIEGIKPIKLLFH
jgi:hypothetical protein